MPPFNSGELRTCQTWVRKVAKYVPPVPLVLSGVKQIGEHAVGRGGFADTYQGTYKNREVAIKVIRTFITEEDRKRVQKVLSSPLSSAVIGFSTIIHSLGCLASTSPLASISRPPTHPPFLGVTEEIYAPRLGSVFPWMSNGNILNYLERNPRADRQALVCPFSFARSGSR
jgi:hypothetical protein